MGIYNHLTGEHRKTHQAIFSDSPPEILWSKIQNFLATLEDMEVRLMNDRLCVKARCGERYQLGVFHRPARQRAASSQTIEQIQAFLQIVEIERGERL